MTKAAISPAALKRLKQERDDFWVALYTITQYLPPAKLQTQSEKLYGLPPEEAVEYAYENVLALATHAIKGTRKPKPEGN